MRPVSLPLLGSALRASSIGWQSNRGL